MQIATFVSDVTPPPGSPLCLGLVPSSVGVTDPLSCRGVVLLGDGDPIVLAALDWVEVRASGHRRWREALAHAAGTTPERVAVQTLHQHDAPGYDPDGERVMAARGMPGRGYHARFAQQAIDDAVAAVQAALGQPETVTDIGVGAAAVHRVASSRRVLGADGRVAHVRHSSERDPEWRAAPEGVIDPLVRVISFWQDERPAAVLSYYATHPQSYYYQRRASCDFVGLAREQAQADLPARAVWTHFCGAGGDVTAGKYNDGSPGNRPVLAGRLADGLRQAFAESARHRSPLAGIGWESVSVTLPLADHVLGDRPEEIFADNPSFYNAERVGWTARAAGGAEVDVSCLRLDHAEGQARVLHAPGELFVEYQLAAQALRPDLFVAMAAYGDCGPGYIGTRLAYGQGGYETSHVSWVGPGSEDVLFPAIGQLLDADPSGAQTPSDIAASAPRLDA